MDSPAARRPGARVRPELPVRRVAILVVDSLDTPGDSSRGAPPVHGARFRLEEGTLAVISPARPGRTVLLCLAGDVDRTGGSIENGRRDQRGDGHSTRWRLTVSREAPRSDHRAGDVVAAAGAAALRAAERLGLGPLLNSAVADLAAPQRVLLGLATALGDGPDVVALDDPGEGLTDQELVRVLDALRDLVDVEGRTVLVAADVHAIPRDAHPLLDQVVDLEHSVSEGR